MTAMEKHSAIIQMDHMAAAVKTVMKGTDEIAQVRQKLCNQ